MSKHTNAVIVVIVGLLLTLLIGCDPQGSTKAETGTLTLEFESRISRSTLKPDIEMEVHSYEISGIGPEGRTFTPVRSNGEPVTIDNLFNGEWRITVLGLNEDDIAIGEGSSTVNIIPENKVTTSITVVEYAGDGIMSLEINWPAYDIVDPQPAAKLTNLTTNETIDLTFISDLAQGKATSVGDIPAGYYTLNVGLYDGSTADINNKLFGTTKAVRVVTDNTTSGIVTVEKDDLTVYGDLSVRVGNGLPSPFSVSLTQSDEKIFEGDSISFTVTADTSGDYSYYWYVDGALQDETEDQFILVDSLPTGKHSIDVVAFKNGVLASASTSFSIEPYPDNFFRVRLLSLETDEVKHEFLLEYGLNLEEYVNIGYQNITEDILASEISSQKILFPPSTPSYMPDSTIIIGFSEMGPFSFDMTTIPEGVSTVMFQTQHSEIGEFALSPESFFGMNFQTTDVETSYDGIGFDSSDSTGGTLSITKYGEVGEYISGSISLDAVEVYAIEFDDDSYGEPPLFGQFNVVSEFNVLRAEDYIVHALTFDGNGADTTFEISQPIPTGVDTELLTPSDIPDDESLEKSGYYLAGWSSTPDGSGDVYLIGDEFTMPDHDVTLYAVWKEPILLAGQAGGYVFYDKGYTSDGWRYLEVSPEYITIGSQSEFIFGYYKSPTTGEFVEVGTSVGIGTGKANTRNLVDAFGSAAYINDYSSDTTGDYAAKLCDDYSYGDYDDWFLPSQGELYIMVQSLRTDPTETIETSYWSSTENDYYSAGIVGYPDGDIRNYSRGSYLMVRPIRAY